MKHQFSSSEEHQHTTGSQRQNTQETQSTAGHEFATPEEMLRFDASRTIPPPGVAIRLRESLVREPVPAPAWWRRLWPW